MDLRVVFCCLVLLFAGCSAPSGSPQTTDSSPERTSPTGTETTTAMPTASATQSPTRNPGDLSIRVQNPQGKPYAVQIALVRGDVAGFTVTYHDGTTRTYDETTVSTLPPGSLNDVAEIRPANAVTATRINATGRSLAESRLPQPTGDRTVFYAVFRLDQPRGLRVTGGLRCERTGPWNVVFDLRDGETIGIDSNC